MATSSTTSIRVARRVDASRSRANRRYFAVFCVSLIVLNSCTFLYHLSGSTVFNAAVNGIGIALIAYSIIAFFGSRSSDINGVLYLSIACAMVALSVLYNFTTTSATDVLKYLSIYIFYAVGRSCGGEIRRFEVRCLYVLAALPIIFLLIGSSKINDPLQGLSYFPNANTAVLFFSALLFAVAQSWGNRAILLQFLNAALMNKIGAVLATAVAVFLWILFPLRKESIIALVLVALCVVVAFLFGAFDRALAVYDSLVYVFTNIPAHSVASMSYRELVQITGTTDLSAFFRIIHWSNILDLYTRDGLGVILFGYGAGQTIPLTYASLEPHNDYLRVLAEYGVLNLAIFVVFLTHILVSLKKGAPRVLFIVLCTYFFTENLLDNFTSMAIYFAYAGRFSMAAKRPSGPLRLAVVNYDGSIKRIDDVVAAFRKMHNPHSRS